MEMRDLLFAEHRVNSVKRARDLPASLGAEIDLRTRDRGIVLNHEPFQDGDLASDFFEAYGCRHLAPLILNVKEDALEEELIHSCARFHIENYFFLDLAFPTLVRLSMQGFDKLAVRVSEYESLETAKRLSGKVRWAWVDSFTGKVPDKDLLHGLQSLHYRLAIVSPELHGYPLDHIQSYRIIISSLRPKLDVICTKSPALWSQQ